MIARARHAVSANFLLHGVVWGAWAAQIPLAKERLGAGPGLFGLALLTIAMGAIISMPLTGALINRFGSRMILSFVGPGFAILFLGPVLAPDALSFMLIGPIFGMVTGAMDVAMNAHGLTVERRLGKPVMSAFHGAFSLGGLIGAFIGGLLVREYGGLVQALLMSGLALLVLLAVRGMLLPSQVDKGLSASHFGWPTRASLVLGVLCFLALMAEGAVIDWSAIYLQQRFMLDAGTAALGYALFSGGMAFSRFAGDYLRAKAGSVHLVRWSAVMMAIGMAGALLSPHPWMAIAVLIFTGIGIGNIAPILFAGGGKIEPAAPARGIAAVVSLGYAGFLFGPPLIGITAEWAGLGSALWIIAAAGVAIAMAAGAVAGLDRKET